MNATRPRCRTKFASRAGSSPRNFIDPRTRPTPDAPAAQVPLSACPSPCRREGSDSSGGASQIHCWANRSPTDLVVHRSCESQSMSFRIPCFGRDRSAAAAQRQGAAHDGPECSPYTTVSMIREHIPGAKRNTLPPYSDTVPTQRRLWLQTSDRSDSNYKNEPCIRMLSRAQWDVVY